MRGQRGRVNIFGTTIILALLAIVAAGALFGPYYWDYLVVKELTRTAALTFVETEQPEKAKEELMVGVQQREVPEYFDPATMCTFEQNKVQYTVRCRWTAYVYYPLTDYYKALPFDVTSQVNAGGQVSTF